MCRGSSLATYLHRIYGAPPYRLAAETHPQAGVYWAQPVRCGQEQKAAAWPQLGDMRSAQLATADFSLKWYSFVCMPMINHRRAVPGRRVRPYIPSGHGEAQDTAQISRFDVCESTFSVYSQSQLQASSASRLGPFRPKKLRPLRFSHPPGHI